MYTPNPFAENDPGILIDHIGKNPFATVITGTDAGPMISHIPMYYVENGGKGALVGHLARANDHWKCLDGKSVAIFHGPHAYISPKWYGTPNVVPTWNYIAVHVQGTLKATDAVELDAILDLMLKEHEGDVSRFKSNCGENYLATVSKHIVGIRMDIAAMEGKWKLSQNKSEEARKKIAGHLFEAGDWNSRTMAEEMNRTLISGPDDSREH